ncbi:MAG: formate dehydrogenase, partial [Actinobacteria bacterium]|uniref:Unannotated protein n=1 Tax=freshwater metagenome TaxID=449393 RepID=A0A6J5ZQM4_9ZZZZ|nr:formate dehydrogenase [Actinomycetota bacterium]
MMNVGMLEGRPLASSIGLVHEFPWFARQKRITFARMGVIAPLAFDQYVQHGGLEGLKHALAMDSTDIVSEITHSQLRGRGGAGFPTGIKWKTVLDTPSDQKYVCCNADEGDSGTFADRMLMEGDPFSVIEGMVIAGIAVGATQGYIYIRSEYPDAIAVMRKAVEIAAENTLLGSSILGSGKSFELHVRVGAGSYVCGEETAMLESLEGKRGVVRAKPPLPAIQGLFGKPTVVNNVLTLATVPAIMASGSQAYCDLGTGTSRGTQVFQLSGNVAQGGIVEIAFGVSLGTLVQDFGAGTRSGKPVKVVQVGGPLGSYLGEENWITQMTYEDLAQVGGLMGHGGVVVFDDSVNMAKQARFAMEFCAEESCGKCTPCRIGSTRGVEVIDRIVQGVETTKNIELLNDLCEAMTDGSLCAMGGLTPLPVLSALKLYPQDFGIQQEEV